MEPTDENSPDRATRWKERETKLLDHVHSHMQWMMRTAGICARRTSILSHVALFLVVAAPLFAVTSAQTSPFGMPGEWLRGISAVLTVALALTEGLRRLGRYDERWRILDKAMLDLRSAREMFRRARLEQTLGSEERVAAYKAFRAETDRILSIVMSSSHKDPSGSATTASRPRHYHSPLKRTGAKVGAYGECQKTPWALGVVRMPNWLDSPRDSLRGWKLPVACPNTDCKPHSTLLSRFALAHFLLPSEPLTCENAKSPPSLGAVVIGGTASVGWVPSMAGTASIIADRCVGGTAVSSFVCRNTWMAVTMRSVR